MSEPRFRLDYEEDDAIFIVENDDIVYPIRNDTIKEFELQKLVDKLNEQQELIEELQVSDEMGWKRAEHFEKELKQKKIYIKRLEYKVQKFKEMNSEQQDTINKLRKILAEAEDTIEIRLPEHYLKEYENIKHNIIGD